MTYEREQISIRLGRLDETPERLICITGPRQTGKTTLFEKVEAERAGELKERLRDTLTPEEARLISVCVIDVSRL